METQITMSHNQNLQPQNTSSCVHLHYSGSIGHDNGEMGDDISNSVRTMWMKRRGALWMLDDRRMHLET